MRSIPGSKQSWWVYILLCGDGSFYTGATTDLSRRFREHCEGRASRYTRARKPVRVVYQEGCKDRSQALKRELAVKALSRVEKEELVQTRGNRKGKTRGSWTLENKGKNFT